MFISKLWRGEYSLAKTYWLFAIFINLILSFPIGLFETLSPQTQASIRFLFIPYFFIFGVYNIITAIGLWRSANNYQKFFFWKYLAKTIAVISFLVTSITFILVVYVTLFEESSYKAYACSPAMAIDKPLDECNKTHIGSAVFKVDTKKSEIYKIFTSKSDGLKDLKKLENCEILDSKNWSCGGVLTIEDRRDGGINKKVSASIQMINGEIFTKPSIIYMRPLTRPNETVTISTTVYEK